MRKALFALFLVNFFMVGCGDDSKKSPTAPIPESSSEVMSSSSEEPSSSSVQSSSAVIVSSSSVESSSSWEDRHLAWNYLNPDLEYKELVDPRDNHVYKYVEYENAGIRMMAENLNYSDSVANPKLLRSSWCPNNSLDSCSKYGRLYTWAAAMNLEWNYNFEKFNGKGGNEYFIEYQGLCPDGWFVYINKFMWQNILPHEDYGYCAQEGWPLPGCTNEFGFTVLPGGYYEDGEFKEVGVNYHYWSVQGGGDSTGGFGSFTISEGDYGVYTTRNINFMKNKLVGAAVRCYQMMPQEPSDEYAVSSSSNLEESSGSDVEGSSSSEVGESSSSELDESTLPLSSILD